MNEPDLAIVDRIRRGETHLYEVLIRRYNQRLYRIARSFVNDDAEAQDVMQEAYIKAYTALPRFQGRALFSTWLTRILINCALGHLRSRARLADVTLDESRVAAEDSVDRAMAREQVARLIERTIDTLPSKYRAVFIMRELEDMTVAETAACIGITPVNAKVRLHRAKRLLREGLQKEMPDISLYGFFGVRCDRMTNRIMDKIRSGQLPAGLPHAQVVDELRADVGAH